MPLPLRLCLCLLSLVWSYRVSAQTPLPADGLFSAKNHVQFLIDHSGRLTRQQAWADSARFQPILADIPQFASRQVPHWFRARVVNPTGRPASLVAEIDYPFLDSTVFFILDTHGRLLTRSPPLSWAMPASKRPLLHHNPLLPFVLGPHSQAWLYVRVRAGKMRLTLPLRLHTSTGFLRADRQQRTFWDATMGLMGFIVLFSLFLFVLLRDLIYAFYGLYVLASLFYLIGNEGYGLVWLDRPMYGFISPLDFPIVSLYLAILASFGLIRVYVLPSVLHHRWIKRIYRVSVLGPVLATVFLLSNVSQWVGTGIGGSILPLLEPLAYMIPVVFMPGLLVYLSLRRLPVSHPESVATVPARLYLLAVSLPLIQVLLGFLRERDLIPDQFINREGAALTYSRISGVDCRARLSLQTYGR
jgi:hypothetical protein